MNFLAIGTRLVLLTLALAYPCVHAIPQAIPGAQPESAPPQLNTGPAAEPCENPDYFRRITMLGLSCSRVILDVRLTIAAERLDDGSVVSRHVVDYRAVSLSWLEERTTPAPDIAGESSVPRKSFVLRAPGVITTQHVSLHGHDVHGCISRMSTEGFRRRVTTSALR